LKARRTIEQGHQRIVAQVERERLALEEKLRGQQGRIAEGKRLLQKALLGPVDAQTLRLHAMESIHLARTAQRLVIELAGAHRRLEAARAELIEATRRRRAVELLRERRFEQWNSAMQKAETAAIDELAVIAAARARGTNDAL